MRTITTALIMATSAALSGCNAYEQACSGACWPAVAQRSVTQQQPSPARTAPGAGSVSGAWA